MLTAPRSLGFPTANETSHELAPIESALAAHAVRPVRVKSEWADISPQVRFLMKGRLMAMTPSFRVAEISPIGALPLLMHTLNLMVTTRRKARPKFAGPGQARVRFVVPNLVTLLQIILLLAPYAVAFYLNIAGLLLGLLLSSLPARAVAASVTLGRRRMVIPTLIVLLADMALEKESPGKDTTFVATPKALPVKSQELLLPLAIAILLTATLFALTFTISVNEGKSMPIPLLILDIAVSPLFVLILELLMRASPKPFPRLLRQGSLPSLVLVQKQVAASVTVGPRPILITTLVVLLVHTALEKA